MKGFEQRQVDYEAFKDVRSRLKDFEIACLDSLSILNGITKEFQIETLLKPFKWGEDERLKMNNALKSELRECQEYSSKLKELFHEDSTKP